MGCDIHMITEVREDGAWRLAEPFWPCSCVEWRTDGSENCYWCHGSLRVIGFADRNYLLFSKLAGVRSYDDFPRPVVAPRGFPVDVSIPGGDIEPWGDHSASWYSLRELEAQDWSDTDSHFEEFVSAMRKVADSSDLSPDDVRIVFNFDN